MDSLLSSSFHFACQLVSTAGKTLHGNANEIRCVYVPESKPRVPQERVKMSSKQREPVGSSLLRKLSAFARSPLSVAREEKHGPTTVGL